MEHWLILRGLAREQRHWRHFPEALRAAHPGCGVHGIDLPGTGTEHKRNSPLTVRGIVEDMRARWLAMRAASPGTWRLLGVSLGGMITMQWCADHPEDFEGIVVVNSSAADLAKPWERMSTDVVANGLRSMTLRDPIARERAVIGFTTALVKDVDTVAREWAPYQLDRPIATRTVLSQVAAASRFRAPPTLPRPALFLVGLGDKLAAPVCSERLSKRYAAPIREHPTAGHDMGLDAPEWMAEQVAAWAASRSEEVRAKARQQL